MTDTATILDALATAGYANIKHVTTYVAERPVTGAAPYLVTLTVTEEMVSTSNPAATAVRIEARRQSNGRVAVGVGADVETAISALSVSALD